MGSDSLLFGERKTLLQEWTPTWKGGTNEIGRVTFPESVPICLWMSFLIRRYVVCIDNTIKVIKKFGHVK